MVPPRCFALDAVSDRLALAEAFGAIAVAAGREILQFKASSIRVRTKADESPVTDADERAQDVILASLAQICPGLPVVAEEAVARGGAPAIAGEFLLVDPLDGTREFVAGLDEFTVNIALVCEGLPTIGAVYAPAAGRLWIGAGDPRSLAQSSAKAWVCDVADPAGAPVIGEARTISTRPIPPEGPIALVSRVYNDDRAAAFIRACAAAQVIKSGSSIKFCKIAEGVADIYPRFGPSNAWDIAAGDAVLRAAGGLVLRADGQAMVYRADDFACPFFIAFGDRAAARTLIENAQA